MDIQKILDLCRELKQEAWHEGFYSGLYDFQPTGHTVENRQKINERKEIKEKIMVEIEEALSREGAK